MAILTGITNAVRANIAGAAQRAVKSAASDIKSIAGLNPTGSNSNTSGLSSLGAVSNNLLTYPLAVDNDPQQGHYILFHINTRVNGKLSTPKGGRRDLTKITSNLADVLQLGQIAQENFERLTSIQRHILDGPKMKKAEKDTARNTSIVLSRLPTKRLERSIALYMPPNVQVQYDIKYGETDIGFLGSGVDAAIQAFTTTPGSDLTKARAAFAAARPDLKEGAKQFALGAADAVASGTKALQQLSTGTVITPRMEMMFEGVGRRNFSYTFNFIPKSEQEARVVEEIIHQFKFYAMPKFTDGTTKREMDIPGTFDIEYMYRNSRNNFLNRVHTCFLTSVSVQYGADRYTTYKETSGNRGSGAPPQKSTLTLNFSELEVLNQDHITDGY